MPKYVTRKINRLLLNSDEKVLLILFVAHELRTCITQKRNSICPKATSSIVCTDAVTFQ